MVDSEKIHEFRQRLLDWSEGNLRDFPWREESTPYEVLIAEILLSATLATKVEPVYQEVLETYPDFEALAEADVEELANVLEPLGLQNRRAKALVSLGEKLRDEEIPTSVDELRDLPWVDHYGANALLCFGFGKRRPIVDVNVNRIFNRIFSTNFVDTEDLDAWEFAEKVLPEEDVQRFNFALLDFGALICTTPVPKCDECFMNEYCDYYRQTHNM